MDMLIENQKRFAGIYAKVSAIVYHRPICHITILCVSRSELEERAGCMCLRFETAKKVQSVDVEASAKVEKMKVTNVHGKLTGAQTFDF